MPRVIAASLGSQREPLLINIHSALLICMCVWMFMYMCMYMCMRMCMCMRIRFCPCVCVCVCTRKQNVDRGLDFGNVVSDLPLIRTTELGPIKFYLFFFPFNFSFFFRLDSAHLRFSLSQLLFFKGLGLTPLPIY